MAQTGYQGKVYIFGSPIAFVDSNVEAVTGKTNTYWSVTPAERILSRSNMVILENNNVALPASDIASINYLTGEITTNAAYAVGNLQLTASRLPMIHVANVKSFTLNCSSTMLDNTTMVGMANSDYGFMNRVEGLQDVSVDLSLTRLDDVAYPARAMNEAKFRTELSERRPVLIELQTKEVAPYSRIRGFFVVESNNEEGDVDALEMESVTLQLDGEVGASFDWQDIV